MIEPVVLPGGITLPDAVVRKLIDNWETTHTADWFRALPALVTQWCDRYTITLDPSFPGISYNIVLFGTSATLGPVVLKISPPHEESRSEVAALRLTRGPDVVTLHAADPDAGVMLIARVLPGTPLRAFDATIADAEATSLASTMLRAFWREVPADEPDVIPTSRWWRDLFRYDEKLRAGAIAHEWMLPADVTATAVAAANRLLASAEPATLLHGDMHHGNILANAAGGWTIIDPKGLSGHRAYDIGTWMLNDAPASEMQDVDGMLRRRLEIFAEELAMPIDVLRDGALTHSALAASWALVDSTPEQARDDRWLGMSIARATILAGMTF